MAAWTGPVSLADVDVPPFETAVTFDADDPQKEYPGYPLGIAAGDYDGDQDIDLVVVNTTYYASSCPSGGAIGGSVTVFTNTGDWSPIADGLDPTYITVCSDCAPQEVAFAYIDEDAELDIVVSAGDYDIGDEDDDWGIYISLQSNGQFGSFTKVIDAVGDFTTPPRGLVIANFDGEDGDDIAVAGDTCHEDSGSTANDKVYVFLNDGEGNFTLLDDYDLGLNNVNQAAAFEITVADFHRGAGYLNKPDLATSNLFDDNKTSILVNNGSSFSVNSYSDPCSSSWDFADITSGQFNGNSDPDAAVIDRPGTEIRVLYGNGAGSFSHDCDDHDEGGDRYALSFDCSSQQAPNYWPGGIASGNLNCDTKADLAAVWYCSDVIILLAGWGPMSLTKFQYDGSDGDYHISPDPSGGSVSGLVKVLIANLDDDAFGDLVTTNQDTQNISVMINATTSCP